MVVVVRPCQGRFSLERRSKFSEKESLLPQQEVRGTEAGPSAQAALPGRRSEGSLGTCVGTWRETAWAGWDVGSCRSAERAEEGRATVGGGAPESPQGQVGCSVPRRAGSCGSAVPGGHMGSGVPAQVLAALDRWAASRCETWD